jgi:hypothetical protein
VRERDSERRHSEGDTVRGGGERERDIGVSKRVSMRLLKTQFGVQWGL